MERGLRSLSGALTRHEEPQVKGILQEVPAPDFRPHPTCEHGWEIAGLVKKIGDYYHG